MCLNIFFLILGIGYTCYWIDRYLINEQKNKYNVIVKKKWELLIIIYFSIIIKLYMCFCPRLPVDLRRYSNHSISKTIERMKKFETKSYNFCFDIFFKHLFQTKCLRKIYKNSLFVNLSFISHVHPTTYRFLRQILGFHNTSLYEFKGLKSQIPRYLPDFQ